MKSWAIYFVVLANIWNVMIQGSPTFAPTAIPASVQELAIGADPIAKHQLVVLQPGGSEVIQLSFFDPATTKVSTFDTSCR